MRKFAFITALISLFMMTACGNSNGNEGVDKAGETEKAEVLEVYTTIYPLQYFAEQIGGNLVHVTNIIPVGADAHTYEPTAKTMISVASGDMFIYNGAGIEGFVDAMIQSFNHRDIRIVQATEGVDLLNIEEHGHEDDGHDHGDVDPHVWLDPLYSIELAKNIRDALIELMPEQAEEFANNFAELQKELEQLNAEFEKMTEEVKKDTFIVSHAGYGYWEHRYHLHQVSVTGISPTNEPSQKQLQAIVQLAKEHGLSHIAFEKNMTSKVAEAVQKEIGADIVYLHNLEALTEENIADGEDYISLMRKNIEALRKALQ